MADGAILSASVAFTAPALFIDVDVLCSVAKCLRPRGRYPEKYKFGSDGKDPSPLSFLTTIIPRAQGRLRRATA